LATNDITDLLDSWSDGDPEALEKLMELVFDDLRRLARKFLAEEGAWHTLQPTALVNEAYLHLAKRRKVSWQNRIQFFSFLGTVMRRILVDHARLHGTVKRGSGTLRVPLDVVLREPSPQDPELLALDDALKELAKLDARQARIIELRYFAGLTVEEVAKVLGTSASTVKREWNTARLWLLRELQKK